MSVEDAALAVPDAGARTIWSGTVRPFLGPRGLGGMALDLTTKVIYKFARRSALFPRPCALV